MIIDRNIQKYQVHEKDSISDLIQKFQESPTPFAVVCDQKGRVSGVVSNGDLLRFINKYGKAAMDKTIAALMNKNYSYFEEHSIKADQLEAFNYIPLIDKKGSLKAVIRKRKVNESFKINGQLLSENSECLIIAEIGNNHNGDMNRAKELINASVDAGANFAKFQLRDLSHLYNHSSKDHSNLKNLNTEYTLELLKKYNLTSDQMITLFDYCKSVGITPLCTPWDSPSLKVLKDYGMTSIKISSADLTNHPLLQEACDLGFNLILSTGMSTSGEIKETVDFLCEQGAVYTLLLCNSTYPTPYKDVHLPFMETLRQLGQCTVGYSGHERGIFIPVSAVTLGAKVVEKHITTDKNLEGVDHKVSLLPDEFKQMVEDIRAVEEAMRPRDVRDLSQGEIINRANLAKSIYAKVPFRKGEVITQDKVYINSPGMGLQPNKLKQLIGKKTCRDMDKGEVFYEADLKGYSLESKKYQFKNPYGIPVRYHDFEKLTSQENNLDFVEFHLSEKDLTINPADKISKNKSMDFIVHCPELFPSDHILDLCSPDDAYRSQSLEYLKQTIEQTKEIQKLFPKNKKARLITNVGGFTTKEPLTAKERTHRYSLLEDSLKQVDHLGVEVLPQTMPPFPWHFGGQSFHNLFVDIQDTIEFCQKYKRRVCFDVSHSKLACNHLNSSFSSFTQKIIPFTSHVHVSDAKDLDGEGLQIFDGEIDFQELFEQMHKNPKITFIPEIWQGHENNGFGFWQALSLLENHIGDHVV